MKTKKEYLQAIKKAIAERDQKTAFELTDRFICEFQDFPESVWIDHDRKPYHAVSGECLLFSGYNINFEYRHAWNFRINAKATKPERETLYGVSGALFFPLSELETNPCLGCENEFIPEYCRNCAKGAKPKT